MSCVDRLDLKHSAAAEHLCRRILQIQRAIGRNPKAPDFTALATYMKHCDDLGGAVSAPEFDAYVAGVQKAEAMTMKAFRQSHEEEKSQATRRAKNSRGKNQNKDKDGE